MKNLFLIILSFVIALSYVSGADYYSVYQLNFPNEIPQSIFLDGGDCTDTLCSNITINSLNIYNYTKYLTCRTATVGISQSLSNCMLGAKLPTKFLNIFANNSKFVMKSNTLAPFGDVLQFYTSNDSYRVMFAHATAYTCPSAVCFDNNLYQMNFVKKANAIARVGQLNIKNIDNPNLPVQIDVPLSIDQTVCSAFQFTRPNMYKPAVIPANYSDFSANTLINLTVTRLLDGSNLLTQSISLPIRADLCAGLTAFSWTPPAGFVNESVKFRVDTSVIDNQVSSTIPDFTQVTEVIYPTNLNGACWARAYDFTLSNIPSRIMTPNTAIITSIPVINQSESLFGVFLGGAFRDAVLTPMAFDVEIAFNGTVFDRKTFTSGNNLQEYIFNMSNISKNLAPGNYNVSMNVTPNGTGCTALKSVFLTQNLEILPAEVYNVTFHVNSQLGSPITAANITLNLTSSPDFYQFNLNFAQSLLTNSSGIANFSGLPRGNYTYFISKVVNGVSLNSSRDLVVGSNMDVYTVLYSQNMAPVVNLPTSKTSHYNYSIRLNLKDFITDPNNRFDELNISFKKVSGNSTFFYNKTSNILSLKAPFPNLAVFGVRAQDPAGLIGLDNISLNFTNNTPPVIDAFNVDVTNGGTPFTVLFTSFAHDIDGDILTCSLNFGDGVIMNDVSSNCGGLNGVSHVYQTAGTYEALLTVSDGSNAPVTRRGFIYPFNRIGGGPVINRFSIGSSNGPFLKTNLTVIWNVTHSNNLNMNCTLRINAVNENVSCIGSKNILNFDRVGISRFAIIANDSNNTQVLRTIVRKFSYDLTNASPRPIINSFNVDSSNGGNLLTNLNISWNVTHSHNLPIICALRINGVLENVSCIGFKPIKNFALEGVSTFTILSKDINGTQVSKTIQKTFVNPFFLRDNAKLFIDSPLLLGDFSFKIELTGEKFSQRNIKVRPKILCRGIENSLSQTFDNGYMKTFLNSQNSRVVNNFTLFLNTGDFNLMVPLFEDCEFKVDLVDSFGLTTTLTQPVKFVNTLNIQKFASITGRGSDLLNFMNSALKNSIKTGYNTISMNVINNEGVTKDIKLSVISSELGFQREIVETLISGTSKTIHIPIFVDKNMKPGKYPVRISVQDGLKKETKYSYILIN